MKIILIKIIGLYKIAISPILVYFFGHACRYTPTCGEYAKEAIHQRGVTIGLLMATKRIIRCNPLSKGGFDPV